ncbi:MAG: class I SAM-dependent methyltransferase, partial [Thermoplasmata archaeon]|nr:class I SAM-dependent methyltransferase [Thermoplasmata archaeon]
SPGGAVFLRVPNAGGRVAALMREAWLWFGPPVHLHYFTAQSIASAAQSAGMRLEWMRTCQGDAFPFPVEIAAATLRRMLGSSADRGAPTGCSLGGSVFAPMVGRMHRWLPSFNPLGPLEDTELQALLSVPR